MRTWLAVLALAALPSCASIIEGSSDKVAIQTTPPTQSTCALKNARGSYSGDTTRPAVVEKSRTDLNITCTDTASGVQGKTTLESGVEPWAFGNILIGGLIGVGVDWMTGAAYDYPEKVSVPMGEQAASITPTRETSQASEPATVPEPVAPSTPVVSAPATQMQETPQATQPGVIAAPPIFVPYSAQ